MHMSYSIDSLSDGCYPGTGCLINRFDIQNEKQLAYIENRIVNLKISELIFHPIPGNFDFSHYKAIHRFLFEDIYDWAGQIRSIDMSKKGTSFTKASRIEEMGGRIFGRLNRMNNFTGLEHDAFAYEITDFYCSTNMLHPFREGNGRTQRAFLQQLVRNAGYEISFAAIDPDELMFATIQAANGVTDGLQRLFMTQIKKQGE